MTHRDVVIVGAGPVGLMTANLLGGYGISVLLVEDRPEIIDYPRGVGMDDECLRTFQTAGLVDRVLPHTVPNQRLIFLNGDKKVLAEIAPRTDEYGWPRRNGFVQPLADQVSLEGLDRYPHVEVLWSTRMTGLRQDDAGVTLTLEGAHAGEVTASYVVGADGGRSATRTALGIGFEGRTSSTRWLVIDLRNDPLGQPGAIVGADPRRPYASISIPHGIRRFEFMLFDGETEEMVEQPGFIAELLDGFVPDPERVDIVRRRVYTHHSRIVSDFRAGRVLLAGDAAHLMPVWQGQGYNSGIRDASNLAWKLAAVLQGRCDASLLASYDAERHGHARSMIDLSTLVGRVISPTNTLVARARDVFFRGITAIPSAKRYLVEMRFKPMPTFTAGALSFAESVAQPSPVGRLFPQPRVDTRERADVLLDDVLGPWFALLVWNNDPRALLDDDALDRFRRLGGRLVALRPACQLSWPDQDADDVTVVGDRTGRLKEWFDTRPDTVVLVRPDRVVAGASPAQRASAMVRAVSDAIGLAPALPAAGAVLPADSLEAVEA
ncbi:bifunctional 3-(3-hydroxy-phenyl)propionate/3-hydroxycinnamic acid hydroxylase [Blastococcus sp. URHD0036]|uniref:bifunctional 3-(3-hydroxy-phenyl)propionate/3-hydroxycinnamic acid hydroxylase n=1 Tax=Blastococcus sp. URHD0036 TaxID=1380356 RepID=UPI00068D5525|nr:bifunctional 3-(3-hydroxy-phenyl)propionate/3-hydroxycinnamic acid hydroxylase [Blastococcus sp. URHD0036]